MRGLRIENAKMDASLGGRFLLHMSERDKNIQRHLEGSRAKKERSRLDMASGNGKRQEHAREHEEARKKSRDDQKARDSK